MFPLAAAAIGVGALGAVGKFLGGRSQAKEIRRQTAETVRRQTREAAMVQSETEALSAMMGVEMGQGSLRTYLDQMSAEFRRQIEWTRKTGARQASNTQKAATFGLFTDLAGTAFSAASMMGFGAGLPKTTTGMSGLPATGRTMFSAEYD